MRVSAPLPPDVGAFFAGLGMTILDVYGMTETTGAFTANTAGIVRTKTYGVNVPFMQLERHGWDIHAV